MRRLFRGIGWLGAQLFGRGSSAKGPNPRAERPDDQESEPQQSDTSSRRQFMAKAAVGFTALAAAIAGIPILSVLFAPVRREIPEPWNVVGALDDFPVGDTIQVRYTDPDPLPWAGPAAQNAAWIRRTGEEEFVAFSIYCTHTGCPVNWTPGASLFICPCHGGIFDREGDVLGGPPEAPLDRLAIRVRDGQVEIGTAPVPITGETT